jgi:hypothetical protein
MLALKRVALPPGILRKQGISGGFDTGSDSWRITISRKSFPMLDFIETLPSVPLTLYEQNESELVFKLPNGTLPTSFRKRLETEQKPDLAALARDLRDIHREETGEELPPTPAPQVAPMPAPAPAPAPVVEVDRNLTLQFPKQSVSVEAAISILNKAKRRLGNNLRFTIEEGGYLTAIHRIGH